MCSNHVAEHLFLLTLSLFSVWTDWCFPWPLLIYWLGSSSSHKWFTKTGSTDPKMGLVNLTRQHAGIWIPNFPFLFQTCIIWWKTLCRVLSGMTWLSVTTSIYTFTMISITRCVTVIGSIVFFSHLFRLIMHNCEAFFEEHLKSGHIVSTLSILSCWILGLIQAVPLMSTWN